MFTHSYPVSVTQLNAIARETDKRGYNRHFGENFDASKDGEGWSLAPFMTHDYIGGLRAETHYRCNLFHTSNLKVRDMGLVDVSRETITALRRSGEPAKHPADGDLIPSHERGLEGHAPSAIVSVSEYAVLKRINRWLAKDDPTGAKHISKNRASNRAALGRYSLINSALPAWTAVRDLDVFARGLGVLKKNELIVQSEMRRSRPTSVGKLSSQKKIDASTNKSSNGEFDAV